MIRVILPGHLRALARVSAEVQLDALVTHKFSLADAETALVAAQQDPGAIKVIIEPNRPSHAREERAEPVRQPFNA